MERINRQAKTLAEWEEALMPIEIEALHDTYHTNPEEVLTPNEVLDIIVEWNGGIASGYHMRSIISRIYSVELQRKKEQDMEEYRIELTDRNGNRHRDHIEARSAQEAADKIRAEWKGCYIQRISLVVQDWK